MAKWKVNKERINTDIPDRQGNIVGGAVTYPTKRLIVDAKKRIESGTFEEQTYVKENLVPGGSETLPLPDKKGEEENIPKQLTPISNYIGIDTLYGVMITAQWQLAFLGADNDYNVGLNIDGFTDDGYKVPHMSFGIDKLCKGESGGKYKDCEIYEKERITSTTDTGTFFYYLKNLDSFKTNHASYACYPLIKGKNGDGTLKKYNIKETNIGSANANTNNTSNLAMIDIVNNTKSYDIMSFNIIENCTYRLAGWHFHMGRPGPGVWALKKNDDNTYSISNSEYDSLPGGSIEVEVLFFEYQNDLNYPIEGEDGKEFKQPKKQLLWYQFGTQGIILVRRLRRHSVSRKPIDKDDNETADPEKYTWKLCAHALTGVNYVLKSWYLPKEVDGDVNANYGKKSNKFFQDVILKNVVEYDTDTLDQIATSRSDYNFYVNNRLYAEEIVDSVSPSEQTFDTPEYTLVQQDVTHEQKTRTYDVLQREEWKKTKKMVVNCVDDTTCKLFKDYTQQILPSTTIVKAERCKVDDSETIDTDEKIADLEPQNVNYSEWRTEETGKEEDKFVRAEFKVYFDNLDGTNIETSAYSMTDEAEYSKYLEKELEKQITEYPLVEGGRPEYWYMASNKSVVESGVALPPAYKFGEGFNSVDLLKYSGVHFYPMINFEIYTGSTHVSRNSMNVIGSTFERYKMYCNIIDESGKNYAVVNGIVPPIVNWDIQYAITDAYTGKPITGLIYKDTVSDDDKQMYLNESYLEEEDAANGCFGIVAADADGNTKTKWDQQGSINYNVGVDTKYQDILDKCNGVIMIFSIIYKEKYKRSQWHFHMKNLEGAGEDGAVLLSFMNNPNGFTIDSRTWHECTLYSDADKTTIVNELPHGRGVYYAFCYGKDSTEIYIRPLSDSEKELWLTESQMSVSKMKMFGDNYFFNITIGAGTTPKNIKISKAELPSTFELNQSDKTYTCSISTTDLPKELVYTFEDADYILDVDKDVPQKNVFKKGTSISIPYYSGCTFIKYEP